MVFIIIILLNIIQKALLALRSIHYAKSFSVGNKKLATCLLIFESMNRNYFVRFGALYYIF